MKPVTIQAVRGMNDILPDETPYWQLIEETFRTLITRYGYREIRFPIIEKTDLFKRSVGENTDIVEKEMYTFLDRNEDSLTLRPEGTAVCVRAGLEHGLLHQSIQRLFYLGPYFRHERPQKGRYRQFHQMAAEMFGVETPDADAEIIVFLSTFFKTLSINTSLTLELNTLGTKTSREIYRKQLIEYFTAHQSALDEDSLRRLHTNPLRILDSKNPDMEGLIVNAPKLTDHLDTESKEHFDQLKKYLDHINVPYTVNPCLVRGLDYYTKTVFEWTTKELGAQSAVCAGGRFDGLVEQLGGRPTPALGFGIGMERLILLLQKLNPLSPPTDCDIYCITDSPESYQYALSLMQDIRTQFPHLRTLQHCGGGSIKNQFKKADKSGALFAFVIGAQELETKSITIKYLREETPQLTLSETELTIWLQKNQALSQIS